MLVSTKHDIEELGRNLNEELRMEAAIRKERMKIEKQREEIEQLVFTLKLNSINKQSLIFFYIDFD